VSEERRYSPVLELLGVDGLTGPQRLSGVLKNNKKIDAQCPILNRRQSGERITFFQMLVVCIRCRSKSASGDAIACRPLAAASA
jgi:hypothetical protein